ncbi:MAG TPA: hypothetical protein VMZ28_17360 [Kofleriaceae bacterium]|nr:hypothetical protein [Kofleriaceae bacterium]
MKTTTLCAFLAMAVLSAACKGDKKKEGDGTVGAGAGTQGEGGKGAAHECTVIVAAKAAPADPITGTGTDADEAKAEEMAWTDACKKLPPPEQPACKDSSRWSATTSKGTAQGKTTATITLIAAAPPQITGKGSSKENEEAACQAALLDACEKAGAQGDCVAAGTHEAKGKMASSSSK